MKHVLNGIVFGAALALTANVAMAAGEHEAPMRDYGASTIKPWLANGDLVAAIQAQNAKNGALSEDQIIALDKQWRAEVGAGSGPMIDGVLAQAVSKWLAEKKEQTGGVVTEVFVMDAKGLNVAQSDVTSDYWQGDEAKWQKTYPVGPDAVHIGDVEKDESTQEFQSQLSMAVTDPATGKVIGAITVGLNLDALL